ncbi:hypothetical protein ACFL3V_03370 [Nanoarchaeota archaeon]
MKLKFNDALASMDYRELVDVHEDLKTGGHAIAKMVEDKILTKEKEINKYCHVCQSEIDPNSTHNYTLLLGPEGLRRKASFCALDCLKYFISNMEQRVKAINENKESDRKVCNE